jgi:hypothetical protein
MRFLARAVSAALSAAIVSTVSATALADPGAALGGGLDAMVNAWETNSPKLVTHFAVHPSDAAGTPLVRLKLAPGVALDRVMPALRAAGFRLTAQSRINPSLVEGFLPLPSVRAAAAIAGIQSIRATQFPTKHAGLVQSQAVALQKADRAQAKGFDGRGIRVAALSDSFDACTSCATHAADDVKSGDLPADGVTVIEEIDPAAAGTTGEDEGRAMLQLIHDIAPGAKLGFATAFNGELDFANQILALRDTFKADVIVDDVYYSDEPFYSDGIVAQAVDQVAAAGAAYFSSAGNNGEEAWEGVYDPVSFDAAQNLVARGKSNLKLDQIPAAIRPASFHNFHNPDGSASLAQRITTAGTNQIEFQWDEPFYLGKVQTDYNVYVFDKDGNWMDPNSAAFPGFYTTQQNVSTDDPEEFVILAPFPGETHGGAAASDYQFVIGKMNDGPARHLKYVVLNGLAVSQRQGAPSIFGHTAARGGQSVAATYYAIPNIPEDFSAGGPVTMYLDKDGNRLASPDVRRVPQITAGDGVDTTFFIAGSDPDGTGFPNFFGTSAAAPDAAATAALALQAAGGPGKLSPRDVYRILQDTATPLPTPNNRTFAAAFSGPVLMMLTGDWTRWNRYFDVSVAPVGNYDVRSITLDVSPANLVFSLNPNRFHIGESNGVTIDQITRTVSPDRTQLTLAFAPGTLKSGAHFTFGMSVFAAIQGSTQEAPDRFRNAQVTVTLANGRTFTGRVYAPEREDENRFTGAGLVNAAAATRAASGR